MAKNRKESVGGDRGAFGPGPPRAMIQGKKAKDFLGAIKKLINYLGGYKLTILAVWLLAVASTVFVIIGPRILMQATDEIYYGLMNKVAGTGDIDFGRIGQIILLLLGLYLTSALFAYLQGFIMTGVTMRIIYRLRKELSDKIHRLPAKYFDNTPYGEVLSRITNDVDTIGQTLNQGLTQFITAAASMLGIFLMMLTINWQLTLVTLCILPLSLVLVMFIVSKSQKYFAGQQKYLGRVNGHVEEMFASHIVVKAFNGEKKSLETFDQSNNLLYQSAWRANFLSGLMMPMIIFIGNLAFVAICILGGYFAAVGLMTIGGIQAFIQYVRSFTQPVSQIASISTVLQQTAAAAERVFELLGEEEEDELKTERQFMTEGRFFCHENEGQIEKSQITKHKSQMVSVEGILEEDFMTEGRFLCHDDTGTVPLSASEAPLSASEVGQVCFQGISFGYQAGVRVINDFSATIMPGQKVALVGPTGAGKTTIVKLLMRFYDVQGGAILINGRNVQDYTRGDLRAHFGMVLQDTWLFNGTIADNIRYGKLEATDEEVRRAAVAAQADHFIRTLPEGYQMVLNEEADNISQGQKQLLTIARAILADPEILILDEATSSVDTRTEALIQKAMDNLMAKRTTFVIAHRLSTIQNADLILVMQNGDIVEQGAHPQLLAAQGLYANLFQSQFLLEVRDS